MKTFFLNLVEALIEIASWVAIFLSPFLLSATVFLYLYLHNFFILSYLILSLGGIAGIVLAEYVRRKYGCSAYLGNIIATPDISPNEVDEIDRKGKLH